LANFHFRFGLCKTETMEVELRPINPTAVPAPPPPPPLNAAQQALLPRLTAYYEAHNPDHMEMIPKVLHRYADQLDCLFADLDGKYGTSEATASEKATAEARDAARGEGRKLRELERREDAMEGIVHSMNSFWAIYIPVAITMCLAALAGKFIVSKQLQAEGSTLMAVSSGPIVPLCDGTWMYNNTAQTCRSFRSETSCLRDYAVVVLDGGSGKTQVQVPKLNATCAWALPASDASQAGAALLSVLVIIGFFAGMTFLIVLCYKYNCMNLLLGYLGLSVTLGMGYISLLMVVEAAAVYKFTLSLPTTLAIIYNLTITALVAIFWQKGVSPAVTQSNLVLLSVIMSWQISQMFGATMTWCLLFGLACYDLCAVLTPCGPLKLLVNAIQSEGRPLPGLLYEAEVNQGASGKAPVSRVAGAVGLVAAAGAAGGQEADFRPVVVVDGGGDDDDDARAGSGLVAASVAPPAVVGLARSAAQEEADAQEAAQEAARRAEQLAWEKEARSIKLGLGDFVFYSVFAAQAAKSGWAAFAASMIVILMGLGGTLVLLSVFEKALPALPISMFVGLFFFFCLDGFFIPLLQMAHGDPVFL
jgi:presenilin 1